MFDGMNAGAAAVGFGNAFDTGEAESRACGEMRIEGLQKIVALLADGFRRVAGKRDERAAVVAAKSDDDRSSAACDLAKDLEYATHHVLSLIGVHGDEWKRRGILPMELDGLFLRQRCNDRAGGFGEIEQLAARRGSLQIMDGIGEDPTDLVDHLLDAVELARGSAVLVLEYQLQVIGGGLNGTEGLTQFMRQVPHHGGGIERLLLTTGFAVL